LKYIIFPSSCASCDRISYQPARKGISVWEYDAMEYDSLMVQ